MPTVSSLPEAEITTILAEHQEKLQSAGEPADTASVLVSDAALGDVG